MALEIYRVLVEWSRNLRDTLKHFNTINLAIHSLVIYAIGYMIYDNQSFNLNQKGLWLVALIGVLMALFWFFGLKRLRIEVDMRFEQLRQLEDELPEFDTPGRQIFTEGYYFFKEPEKLRLAGLKKLQCQSKFVSFIDLYLYLSFILGSSYTIIIILNFLSFCGVEL